MKELINNEAEFKEFPEAKEFIIATNKCRYKANSLDDVMWLWHYNVKGDETVLFVGSIG